MKIKINKGVFSELKTHISLQARRQFTLKNLIIQIALCLVPLLIAYFAMVLQAGEFLDYIYFGPAPAAMFIFDRLFPVMITFSFTIAFVIGQGKYLSSMIREDFEQKTFFILYTYDADKRLIFLSRLIVNMLFYLCYTIISSIILLFVIGASQANGLEIIVLLFPVILIGILSISLFFYFFMSIVLLINLFLDNKTTLIISLVLIFLFILVLPLTRPFIAGDNQGLEKTLTILDPFANILALFLYLTTKLNLISGNSLVGETLYLFGVKIARSYPNIEIVPSELFVYSFWNMLSIVVIVPTVIIILVIYFSKRINMEVQI